MTTINPDELRIDTYRDSGSPTSEANRSVRVTHLPTGTTVSSSDGRDQRANREICMNEIAAKLTTPELSEMPRITHTAPAPTFLEIGNSNLTKIVYGDTN